LFKAIRAGASDPICLPGPNCYAGLFLPKDYVATAQLTGLHVIGA